MVEQMKPGSGGPEDKFKMVYIIFYWLGIGTLLPWNMFISVNAYWAYKYRNVAADGLELDYVDDGLQANVTSDSDEQPEDILGSFYGYLSAASMVPNVTFLILNAFFGHRLKTQPRLVISLIFVIMMFTFTSVMVQVDTDTWQHEFLIVTLVSVVFININAAIFQGGILGVAGQFPPAYMGAVFSGQAVGGIFASGCNVVFLALGASASQSGFFCFLTSVVFLLTALVAYGVATRSEFYQYYLNENDAQDKDDKEKKPEDSKLLENGSSGDAASMIPVKVNPFQVLIQISPYAAAVLLCFTVTLGCFPTITARVVSTMPKESAWAGTFYIPVACFLLFNIGDYLGRFLAGLIMIPKPSKVGSWITLGLSILRFVFLPLFLFCNVDPDNRGLTSVLFESDTAYIVIMMLFSISNGYVATNCMISGPQIVRGEEAGTAASLMVACLGLGLGIGASLSNIFAKLI